MICLIGAWLVMRNADVAIGMLVAFQMFANRVSQPMLRLVGLWQQFQQAGIAVQRLADIINAPPEPYAIAPSRDGAGPGEDADDLAVVSERGKERNLSFETFVRGLKRRGRL